MNNEICIIRKVDATDVGVLVAMINELADYENLLSDVQVDEAALQLSLFGDEPHAQALLVEVDSEVVGFAIFFYNFSTFLGRYGIYIEDLYIRETYRGKGYGKTLLSYISRLAYKQGCGRIEWSVLDWNKPAIDFYKKIGAKSMDEWTVFRLDKSAIESLAAINK